MALLEIENLGVNYGAIQAVRGLSLEVQEGEVVTLIGANGAGKTTTLRAVSRMVRPVAGIIRFGGRDITRIPPDEAVKIGIAQSPEGRQVLARQSIQDNLELGAYVRSDRAGIQADLQRMYDRFPRLGERRTQLAGTLSGGEQQMLAIARALMSRPKLLLLDEPSLGLAPLIVREIFTIIRELNEQGMTILLVEQNAKLAMNASHRTYVLEAGQLTFSGVSSELVNDERVLHAYLGG
ncbi:ABC transporter ATP-binding protein [Deinococcus radiodurans]|jgi:amino acid/amide ABC transporter ATP-binding protein 2, HAAT family (TC 3.A.1.4.-)|uniref:Branched-chain amino acid ABC transporter, ATP-binding protein n=1 Tax=Deinococcus radiodurans (strain ATCC 13939 / DSM 20539 / JCM 16871 / CCUG 27074 / LMG 4051 / NBRC 15346 / NCIMB 9279 / VKM B-1422 / R1) TaxID=243230 RepID=Q9RSK6_DEIRA|nr:ABC transporter ATP-binding protein [Deinococcus radiodurans]AAF11668.1 branched-chain amino acid ABC transporter, ATP-binding protein [Deinococcus radiodurans R1 = ATCC 13939 = DSM 20539]ANC70818.1 ABC transporter ATP-binding protein [Deinococcus radiodurans R1 = ATCC 13939 = DSM 20539]QEM71506.1 ABC transporter ATP-binding protein [Deinococcus radiodurans]QIP27829.1 ABC transporter ATP-binding protein [Deinococcus radiodurans]QIP31290.1 ABC transporter ATP-binding protein [Deinococcus rad